MVYRFLSREESRGRRGAGEKKQTAGSWRERESWEKVHSDSPFKQSSPAPPLCFPSPATLC